MKTMNYNKLQALEANTAAIATAYQVRNEKRTATAAERETLSLYSGFGGIKEVLDLGTNKPMPEKMKQALDHLVRILQSVAQGDETLYREFVDSIKASVLTAFYTPKILIEAVADQIQVTFRAHGLPMKSFLEPSAGIGGFLPVAMPDTCKAAFEKDLATGLVLSALHPDAKTVINGFETIDTQELENDKFDVIASNIPFGTINVFDTNFERRGTPYKQSLKAIHNYFFIKTMELLSEGGLLAFVTSRGVADSPSNRFVRPYHLAKGQPQAWPHRKGTPVFGNVQGAHSARHGNGICKQGILFAAKHVIHRHGHRHKPIRQVGAQVRVERHRRSHATTAYRDIESQFHPLFQALPVGWAKASAVTTGSDTIPL